MKDDKTMQSLTPEATFSQIVSADRKAATLLASIGLDPSEHGDRTLRSVCRQRQWDEEELLRWIREYRPGHDGESGVSKNSRRKLLEDDISHWCEYLERHFHDPGRKLLADIGEYYRRARTVSGNDRLEKMEEPLGRFREALRLYYRFKEQKLNPLATLLQEQSNRKMLDGNISKLKRSLQIIAHDQKRMNDLMDKLKRKGRNFESPPDSCSALHILNRRFKKLYTKLSTQFRLEKEELIPRIQTQLPAPPKARGG